MQSQWGRITQVYISEQYPISAKWVRVVIISEICLVFIPIVTSPLATIVISCLDQYRSFLSGLPSSSLALHLPLPPVIRCPHRSQIDLLQNLSMTLSHTAAWRALRASHCFWDKVWPCIMRPHSFFNLISQMSLPHSAHFRDTGLWSSPGML